MVGRTISHYRITEKLGEGGMGVVYKAEDTKLERPVALKFLAAHALEDPENKARFLREAKAAARLDHPNICPVHEIDEVDGQIFLAMAYLEGRTVKDKIAERPLKLDEALEIAIQIAQGLKAAHEKEIVHRDIKPANLMLTSQGQVKIMDFGLAQLAEASKLTKTRTLLGTPAYMSPEQARRKPTDRRTDVWSLGVVIYEMVTGRLPFEGERQEAVLYAIEREEHEPVTALRSGLPTELDRILEKALAKSPSERYQHVDDLQIDLLSAGKRPRDAAAPRVDAQAAEQSDLRRKLRIQQALLAVAAVALLAVSFVRFRQPLPEAPLRKFAFTTPSPLFVSPFNTDVAVSPDGRYIAYQTRGGRGLSIQALDRQQPRVLEGTQGANNPFWSPGSDFIGFVAPPVLKKVSIHGGPAIRICKMPRPPRNWGASWSPDGEWIVFAAGDPPVLYEVSASGGTPNLLVSPEESEESEGSPGGLTGGIWRPHFLPSQAGPRVLVFAFGNRTALTMMVQDLKTGRRRILGPGALPFYSPSGHIVYQQDGLNYDLLARPFSLDTLEFTGRPFRIAGRARDPTLAADGPLVYVDAPASRAWKLVWLNRRGEETEQISQSEDESRYLALSPDGGRLAAAGAAVGSNSGDLWVHDLGRGGRTRLYSDPNFLQYPHAAIFSSAWSPSGEQVAFTALRDRAGGLGILLRRADGSGELQELPAPPGSSVCDWSKDGKYLFYELPNPDTGQDLWYLERKEDGNGWEPRVFLQTPFAESAAQLSPDGRYVAYVSDESGQPEIYVRPFPKGAGKTTVSTNGGRQPRWSGDGKELFYAEGSTLVAVSVSTAPELSVGSATRLFEHPTLVGGLGGLYPHYDVSENGQQFVFAEPVGEVKEPSIQVVQNWYEEFRDHDQD